MRLDSEKIREQPNVAVALVIDRSGSMQGPKIEAAKESARATANTGGCTVELRAQRRKRGALDARALAVAAQQGRERRKISPWRHAPARPTCTKSR